MLVALPQVEAHADAVAVGDDERGAVVGFGLHEGPHGLGVGVAHGHLGHVDVAVGHGDGAQVLLADGLAPGGEQGHRAHGRGLGALPARCSNTSAC